MHSPRLLPLLALAAWLTACSTPPAPPARGGRWHPYQTGEASWYGSGWFYSRKTASGERFSARAFTAAHRTLPFGTPVLVTNLRNGRWVIVRINDRGPYRNGRIIDLSKHAAEVIGMRADGVVPVRLAVPGP